MADAQDLKSWDRKKSCGFESRHRHHTHSMAAGQLWLFPLPKPLVERLGDDFFRALPSGPGVYLMCEATGGVLYVGKARNLRKRVSSYRVANPERFPRRIIRLLHRVTRIEWDECASEAAARQREELLKKKAAVRNGSLVQSEPAYRRHPP